MRRLTMLCCLIVLCAGSDAHAGGILRIFGGSGSGDFYRGGGGASFGVDIPVSEDRAFYAGMQFTFHNGSENKTLPDGISGSASLLGDASQSQIGAEVGGSLGSHPWVIRPTVGGGISRIALDSGTIVLTSEIRTMLYGGVTIGRMIADTALIGVEVRAILVGDLGSSVAGYLTLGTTFGG